VLVRAAREREQFADSLERAVCRIHPIARDRCAVRARVDPALLAHPAKRVAVRGLVANLEHFVDELMRHLVLEHREHVGPRLAEHETALELERPRRAGPLAQPLRRIRQHDHRPLQLFPEVRPVDPVIAARELAHQLGL